MAPSPMEQDTPIVVSNPMGPDHHISSPQPLDEILEFPITIDHDVVPTPLLREDYATIQPPHTDLGVFRSSASPSGVNRRVMTAHCIRLSVGRRIASYFNTHPFMFDCCRTRIGPKRKNGPFHLEDVFNFLLLLLIMW